MNFSVFHYFATFRTRDNACDTLARSCARRVLCCPAFPLVPVLRSTGSAAASVSATPNHAVTLLFVNQTAVVDKDPPSDSTTSVRVTMDKVAGRWLISGFDPV